VQSHHLKKAAQGIVLLERFQRAMAEAREALEDYTTLWPDGTDKMGEATRMFGNVSETLSKSMADTQTHLFNHLDKCDEIIQSIPSE
jgi:hypothetical protein